MGRLLSNVAVYRLVKNVPGVSKIVIHCSSVVFSRCSPFAKWASQVAICDTLVMIFVADNSSFLSQTRSIF